MPSDRSRRIDLPANGYVLPIAQQGRVVLDRDFNAWGSFLGTRIGADALDFVGPYGTPDNGFAISKPTTSSPEVSFWSPPQPESPPQGEGTGWDFLISGGTMYVGGLRVEWPTRQHGTLITYSFSDQPELAPPVTGYIDYILKRPTHELVYLDVTLQEVSAAEDPDLLDVALGGPDTTQRLKQRARVERLAVNATSCADAWSQAITYWNGLGLDFDAKTMRLVPAVKLQVGLTQDGPSGGPCDPIAAGGFLGPDNQLIRVQVAQGTLLWSYDNASFAYRIEVASDRQTITLIGGPPDVQHYPLAGQIVEILTTSAVIDSVPDEINGGSIVRAAAQPTGTLFTLAKPYGPATQGATTNVLVLPTPLDPALLVSGLPLFLRVWQAQLPLSFNTPITLQDANKNSTGLTVTLSGATMAADGAFWQIAARPSTPQGVYPEELLLAPQWADGPVHAVCPLAVIDWTATGGPAIADCRAQFDNLVALTKRKPGCCTIGIAPSDLGPSRTLQNVIDIAMLQGTGAKICLAAGTYQLTAPLQLTALHSGLTLECCGGEAVLLAAATADASLFSNGLITLNAATCVTLQGLVLRPPLVQAGQNLLSALTSNLSTAAQAEAATLLRTLSLSIGIHAGNATSLKLQSCRVEFFHALQETNIDLVTAGLLLRGDCQGLVVEKCSFSSAFAPTYNALDTSKPYTGFVAVNRQDFLATTTLANTGTIAAGTSLAAAGSTLSSSTLTLSQGLSLAAATISVAPTLTLVPDSISLAGTALQGTALTLDTGLTHAASLAVAPAPSIAAEPTLAAPHITLAETATPASTLGLEAAPETLNLGGTNSLAAPVPAIETIPSLTSAATATVQAQPHQQQQANGGGSITVSTSLAAQDVAAQDITLATTPSATLSLASDLSLSSAILLDTAQQLYSSAGLAQILASRSNAGYLAMQRPMVASCGIAAATWQPSLNQDSTLTEADFLATLTECSLNGALIRDNDFTGLTFAALLSANAQALRVQDNDITNGVAGIWVTLPEMGPALNPAEGTNIYSESVFNFEEYQALSSFLPLLPLPQGLILRQTLDSATTQTTATSAAARAGGVMNFNVFITGNQVSTGQHPAVTTDATASTALTGASALLLWLIPQITEDALGSSDISAIVANNHFITASGNTPSAMLALANLQAGAVNGNVILNQPGPIEADLAAPSLWVVISESLQFTEPFAASGNVLRGLSDLNLLTRGAAAQRAGWSGYNADPF
jgi:hypothetical protein